MLANSKRNRLRPTASCWSLQGMCYLHQSFGPHGNLKSTNCVVSGRWVLQITDYDLYELRHDAAQKIIEDENASIAEKRNVLKSKLFCHYYVCQNMA